MGYERKGLPAATSVLLVVVLLACLGLLPLFCLSWLLFMSCIGAFLSLHPVSCVIGMCAAGDLWAGVCGGWLLAP